MKKLLALTLLLAPCAAFAWDCPAGYTDTPTGCVAPPGTTSAAASATAGQGQWQGQAQGQGQTQSASGGAGGTGGSATGGSATQSQQASNAGNAQSTTEDSSFSYPRQTPIAIAPDLQATVSCFKPITLAGSTPLFGLAGGGGKIDKVCQQQEREAGLRATARMLAALGEVRLAVMTLCALPSERDALGAACVYATPPPVVAIVPAPQARYVTPEQLQEVERRILQRVVQK